MKKFYGVMLSIIALLMLISAGCYNYFTARQGTLHIAFAGPMSGAGAAAGRLMTQAIQLYFDQVNKLGGVNNKLLQLDIYDDQNDCDGKAKQVAEQINQENKAVAVIGHWYSSCSISGGEVYKKSKIPAITPGSVDVKVTQNNEWYFRNIYTANSAGQFLANYVKKVFHQNTVTIIHEKGAFGFYLAKIFEETSHQLGMEVKKKWAFENQENNLNGVFQNIVKELETIKKEAGVLLLSVQAPEGVKLVTLIKDAGIQNPIIGPSSFSEDTFHHGFENLPKEKGSPGFYINDIYIETPLIFDTANEKAQQFKENYRLAYGESPDWSAAYAYDTAMLLIKAIEETHVGGNPETLLTDRQKIRDTLASYTNSEEAMVGTTGLNYFENRDAQKPVSIGVYKNRSSVSALTQLQVMGSSQEISDLPEAIREERVLQINGRYMYKTNVVYAGVEFKEVGKFEEDKLVCTLDFYIWFRFQGDFNPQDVEFLNAIDPEEPRQQLKEPIAKKTKDKITYHLYRVRSRFKVDFIPNEFVYKQHLLGIKFRHRTLTRHNLIYVTDIIGMGATDENEPLSHRMEKNQVINPLLGWSINRAWVFQNITKKSSLGDPKYLNVKDGMIEYSEFNAVMRVHKNDFTLRGKVPYKYAHDIMLASAFAMVFFVFLGKKFNRLLKYFWFFQLISSALLLLAGEVIFMEWLASTNLNLQLLLKFFDILWWIVPAYFINEAVERFIWSPLEKQLGAIPNIIRHFFAMIVYFVALICIIVFVYKNSFTSLLATSGMLAMIIGLAIQINISNLFSGMIINLERPFRIGDWVQIGKVEECEVVDINWRATRLQTRMHSIISLPNTVAAESSIVNYYYPDNVYWLWPTVYIHPKHSPDRVKKILLDAILSAETILKYPEPVIIFTGVNEWAASYWVAFCSDNYELKPTILAEVWERIVQHLEHAAIQPAVRRQEVYMFRGEETMKAYASMQEKNIFRPFEERKNLPFQKVARRRKDK